MLPDYHIHSTFSCDAHDSMAVICRAALSLGLQEIGFSEHLDFHPLDECLGFFQVDQFWEALELCRASFGSQLTLRAGLETGEPHLYAQELKPVLTAHPWDYVLGSQHWIEDLTVFDPSYFEQPAREAYERYFTYELELVRNGDFDILAHMDIPKRYGFDAYGEFNPQDWQSHIRAVLAELARRDRALEVNSGTLRRPVNETSPAAIILRWFHEEGGRLVTFGSDAHRAEHVGYGCSQVSRQLQTAGFREFARYERRQPELHPLPGLEV
ncbi:MAG: histidinol-phosphatase [Anaerolineales bacterium]|jgi:histidinol-phosphatase (PHP family)